MKAKSAKYLQNVLQLGNFMVKKYGDGEYLYVRVCTIDGSWRMDFREDTFKYAWALMLTSEPKYYEILRAWITLSYHTTMASPDPIFIDKVIKEIYALQERAQNVKKNEGGVIVEEGKI